jgi:hypothetical protein
MNQGTGPELHQPADSSIETYVYKPLLAAVDEPRAVQPGRVLGDFHPATRWQSRR